MGTYRVVIADDHSLVRQGIKSILAQDQAIEVVGEASTGIELLDFLRGNEADLIILDITMPQINGLEAVSQIKKSQPDMKILVVTMHGGNQYFYQAISAGVHGYLMKDDSEAELLQAIACVRRGKTYVSPQLSQDISGDIISAFRNQATLPKVSLSKREKEVLGLVVQGHTSKKIGELLKLSPRTVDHHRANLLKKFNMKNTVDLVNYVVRNDCFIDG